MLTQAVMTELFDQLLEVKNLQYFSILGSDRPRHTYFVCKFRTTHLCCTVVHVMYVHHGTVLNERTLVDQIVKFSFLVTFVYNGGT